MRLRLALLAILAATSQAPAACFPGIGSSGCTDGEVFPRVDLKDMSCQDLWFVRNTIYDENGLCFKTKKAQAVFSSRDCYVDNPAAVKLNTFERENVKRIREVEVRRGCTQ